MLAAALAALQAPPAGDRAPAPIEPPASWFSQADYPEAARKAAVEGAVRFRLAVDADGRPTGCDIVESAGPLLDAATCGILMARARFHPARDARGNPVAGTFGSRIAWRLPLPDALPFAPLHLANRLEIDAQGASRCVRETGIGAPAPGAIEICGVAEAMGLTKGFRRRGMPARLTLVLTVDPDREPAPAPVAGAPGMLVHRSEADVDLAPGGQVSVCVERGPRRGRGRLSGGTPLCLAYLRGAGPLFAAQPAGARSGRLALSVYMVEPPER